MLATVLFAIAVSVDGFAVGVAEGLRGVGVPFSSLVAMNAVSAGVVFAAVWCGRAVGGFLSLSAGRLIGGGTLMVLGAWTVARAHAAAAREDPRARPSGAASALAGGHRDVSRPIALVAALLEEPAKADLDASGTITSWEACLLGMALATDALGVGFGAGMAGLSPALTAVVSCATQTAFVGAGMSLGRRLGARVVSRRLGVLPGGILILLGVLKLRWF